MLDVFFYEAFAEEEPSLRAHLPPTIRAGFSRETVQESGHAAPPAPLVSIRTQSVIPSAWFPAVRGVLARTTGYDHLRRVRADAGPALAMASLPEYCTRAVAEHAALMWMSLLRALPLQMRQFARFERNGLTGSECAGRTLTVVGVGRIGHEICRIGRGLDMNVLGVDISPCHPDIAYVSESEGLAAGDVVVCAMNLTAENREYFSATRLELLKPGAVFINISRGELSPAIQLEAALHSGRLGAVGLDVFNHEPDLAAHLRQAAASADPEFAAVMALSKRSNVILTPHNAFNTREALEEKSRLSAIEAASFVQSGHFLRPAPF